MNAAVSNQNISNVVSHGVFQGRSVLTIREDCPQFVFESGKPSHVTAAILNALNTFLQSTYPGSGSYAVHIERDLDDASKQHFVLYSDDVFYAAYLESSREITCGLVARNA